MKVAYYSPLPPERLASPTTRRCCCPRCASASRRLSSPGPASAGRTPTSRSTTSGTILTRTAGSPTSCAGIQASSSCTSSSSTTWSPESRSRAASESSTWTRWIAKQACGAAARAGRDRSVDQAALGDRPEGFRSRRRSRLGDGLIVHSRTSSSGARGGVRRAALAHPARRVARPGCAGVRRRRSARRLLREPEREQADPAAPRGFALLAERRPGARLLLVGARPSASTSRRSTARAGEASSARSTCPRSACGR